MEDLNRAIGEITKEDIIKLVISNKMNKDVKYKNHDGSLFCELQSMYLSGQPYQKSTFICRK